MRLAAPRRCTFAILLTCAAIACAGNDLSTAPRAPDVNARPGSPPPPPPKPRIAECRPQRDERQSARIGPGGGTLTVGTSRFVVPAGALATEIEITAHAIPSSSGALEFSPAGLQFAKPAVLTMSYAKCATPFSRVTVAYVEADTVSELEPSRSNWLRRTVTAEIRHFSSYAVAF